MPQLRCSAIDLGDSGSESRIQQAVQLILPVPPLEELGVVLPARSVIDCTPEHIEEAPIDRRALLDASFDIEFLRVSALQISHAADPKLPEIVCDAPSHAGDGLELLDRLFLRRAFQHKPTLSTYQICNVMRLLEVMSIAPSSGIVSRHYFLEIVGVLEEKYVVGFRFRLRLPFAFSLQLTEGCGGYDV